MTIIEYKGVKIVTLKPNYCGRGLRSKPYKLVGARKEIKHIDSGYRKKSFIPTQDRCKSSKFYFLWGLGGKNN